MKIKAQKEKLTKISIIVAIFAISAVLIFAIQKSGVIEMARNRIIEQRRAEIESDIQAIIDETKQEAQVNESREATLADLKVKLQKQGYTLDVITGEVKYNGYYVTINDDLTIASIEQIVTKIQYEIISTKGDNLDILLTIENGKGIEKITGSDITLECKGREKIALDRTLQDGQEYQVRVKVVGEQQEELHTLVASKKPNIVVTNTDTLGDGTTKTVEIEYPNNEGLINYYSLDDGATWQEYTGVLNILETDNKTIAAKSLWKEGKTIDNTEEKISLVISDSLLSATEKAVMKNDTHYRIAIKDEEYTVHTYIEDGDLTLASNTAYGDANDVAKNMVIVKANGDLTINQGVTLTAYADTTKGGPKGMLVYATGTLTNNGTISMDAKGTIAAGQNVYLWKNHDTTNTEYEYVPAEGGIGGAAAYKSNGKPGAEGINRQTGGGGSGAATPRAINYWSAKGANGTSYSGGTSSRSVAYSGNYNGNMVQNLVGTTGGGLIIVGAQNVINNNTISSNPAPGVSSGDSGGYAGHGGGSINVFYKNNIEVGNIQANGGLGKANNYGYVGGNGGNGCISIGSISTGTYVEYVETTSTE